jgi:response regulator RpfG family c-di-GMP phosphodiesterase
MMTNKILCVDDEPKILEAFERQLRRQFDLQTAAGPEKGLQAISESGPFAVVVSDLRMPGMNGIEFLSRVRQTAPDAVRIMLTGDADLSAAMMAVNEGNIFQFLTKPCPADMLARSFQASLKQHQLITAERELLEQTLQGSIGALIEVLSLVNPAAFSRTHRIRRYVRHLAEQLKLADRWQYELAATLSQIGCVVVPPEVMDKSHLRRTLTAHEQEILSSQGMVGRNLLAKIPRLGKVAQMVAEQTANWNGTESSDPVLIGAQLLRVALDFDEEVQQGKSLGEAMSLLRARRQHNPKFIDALRQLQIEVSKNQIRLVNLDQLKPGMHIEADLYSKTGLLLLAKGQEVTESAIARLTSFASLFGVAEPISVVIPGADQQTAPTDELPDFSDTLAGVGSHLGLSPCA